MFVAQQNYNSVQRTFIAAFQDVDEMVSSTSTLGGGASNWPQTCEHEVVVSIENILECSLLVPVRIFLSIRYCCGWLCSGAGKHIKRLAEALVICYTIDIHL